MLDDRHSTGPSSVSTGTFFLVSKHNLCLCVLRWLIYLYCQLPYFISRTFLSLITLLYLIKKLDEFPIFYISAPIISNR